MSEPLSKTNPYLRDAKARSLMLARSVHESSVFEGARGLKLSTVQAWARKAVARAARKKSVKAEQSPT